MSLTVNTLTYDEDVPISQHHARYNGPSHTLSENDFVDLKRTMPKPTATFDGQGKTEAKLTRTMTSDGTVVLNNGLISVSTSIPVGTLSTEIDAMIDDMAAWLATAAYKNLVKSLDIKQ